MCQRLSAGRLWWLFLGVVIVSLTALTGVLVQGRKQILQQAEQSAGSLAWVLESRLTSTLQRVDADTGQMLRLLDEAVLDRGNAARERARIEAFLADHVAGFPDVMRTTVFGTDGAVLYSSDPGLDRQFNIAGSASFERLKQNPGIGTLYSEVVAARGDARPALVVSRSLVAPDGRFLGVLNTLLDLDHFQRLIDSIDIGANGLVFVRRRDDNRLVLRRPRATSEVNRALNSPTWRQVAGGAKSGLTRTLSPVDQVTRLLTFRALPDHPFYVVAGLSENDILAGWRQQAWIFSGLAAGSLALLGLLIAGMHRSERRRSLTLEALTRSQDELRVAARAFESQEAMLITDAQFKVLKVNEAYTRVTGFSAEETMGQDAWQWRSVDHDPSEEAAQREALREAGFWAGEMRSRRKSGETFDAWLTISAVRTDDGQATHHVASFTDISERKAAEARIHTLAFYDPLTHLPNRRLLMERLQHTMSVSQRKRSHCALLFLDLDEFKLVNDTCGHAVGDALLIAAAGRLRQCIRASDTVARLGGDEFVVMLEDLGADAAAAAVHGSAVAEKIRLAMVEPFVLDGVEHHASASLGISLFSGNGVDAGELFKRCDTAMYQAKRAGRNALRFFDPATQSALESRAALAADMRQAIALRQFELHFQLQVDRRGRPTGAEALLRWNHPLRGTVPPLDFIPLAEETGAILGIGQWVLDTACDQLAAWAADPLTCDLQLAINVSARQFRQADFVEKVRSSLQRSGARATHLELELTESLVMDDVADTVARMEALRALGVSFSLDDFGTGYSSLAYLQRLPLDQLKIDRSFVVDMTRDDQSAAIVRSIITLAQVLGLDVIAEGVETEGQRARLDKMGCNAFQGYFFARPLPIAAFLERLRLDATRATGEDTSPAAGHAPAVAAGAAQPASKTAQRQAQAQEEQA